MQSWTDLVSGKGDSNDIFFDDFHVGSQAADMEQIGEEPNLPLKSIKKRTRNFSTLEDKMLVKAWLQTSQDPVQGIDQNRSTYWQRIHDYFHEHKSFESDRNLSSLSHRWGIINKSVSVFCGWYTQVHNRKPSGKNEQDKIDEALEMYKGNNRDGKAFTLLHCWNLLRHEQKWLDQESETSGKKQKTSVAASPGSCTPGTHESQHCSEEDGPCHTSPRKGRPDGRKKEKERRGKHLNFQGENFYMDAMENLWAKREKADEMKEIRKKERNDERLAVETKRLELKQEVENRKLDLKQRELELKQREDDEKVMNMDLSRMSERQRLFYTKLQDQIIARRFGGSN